MTTPTIENSLLPTHLVVPILNEAIVDLRRFMMEQRPLVHYRIVRQNDVYTWVFADSYDRFWPLVIRFWATYQKPVFLTLKLPIAKFHDMHGFYQAVGHDLLIPQWFLEGMQTVSIRTDPMLTKDIDANQRQVMLYVHHEIDLDHEEFQQVFLFTDVIRMWTAQDNFRDSGILDGVDACFDLHLK